MIPVQDFPEANITMKAPAGMPNCIDVRAFKSIDQDQIPFILTLWQPSPEDIAAINRGDAIALKICGEGMPPVSLFTVNEKGEVNP